MLCNFNSQTLLRFFFFFFFSPLPSVWATFDSIIKSRFLRLVCIRYALPKEGKSTVRTWTGLPSTNLSSLWKSPPMSDALPVAGYVEDRWSFVWSCGFLHGLQCVGADCHAILWGSPESWAVFLPACPWLRATIRCMASWVLMGCSVMGCCVVVVFFPLYLLFIFQGNGFHRHHFLSTCYQNVFVWQLKGVIDLKQLCSSYIIWRYITCLVCPQSTLQIGMMDFKIFLFKLFLNNHWTRSTNPQSLTSIANTMSTESVNYRRLTSQCHSC